MTVGGVGGRRIRTRLLVRGLTTYRAGTLRYLARRPELDLEVWNLGTPYRLPPAFQSSVFAQRVVPGLRLSRSTDHLLPVNPPLIPMLSRDRPDVVIASELSLGALQAAVYCRLSKRPLVVWTGGTRISEKGTSALKTLVRKAILRSADAFISYGGAASEYLVDLGADAGRIFHAFNTTDLAWWRDSARLESTQCEAVRREFGVRGPVVAFVGQLILRKRPDAVLDLARVAIQRGTNFQFVMAGAGAERGRLEGRIARESLGNVHLVGQRDMQGLARLYGISDFLVLPSFDIWGMVVMEAMAGGVVPVVSPEVECHKDVIRHDRNGYVVDFSKPAKVLDLLLAARSSQDRWEALRKTAAESVLDFGPEQWSQAFVSAVQAAVDARASRRT